MNLKIPCLFLCLLTAGCAGPIKRASKNLEKAKYEKVEKILDRQLEKDSLNPGAYYIYSLLFITPEFERYSIDSAHFFVTKAIEQYSTADKKHIRKLKKAAVNDSTLQKQILKVDSIAFERALSHNTVEAYQYFIDNFPTAPQMEEAVEIRNELAYQQARKLNTYEAYKSFLDNYPEARQITEASELYEFLLYENKTKDRKLGSYIKFLEEHPHTNYTIDAQNNIFELTTAGNQPQSYLSFISRYPGSPLAQRAINFLYHISKTEGVPFFQEYNHLPVTDSLQKAAKLEAYQLLAIYGNGQYGFMNSLGEIIITPSYTTINPEYLCGNIQSDYLTVGHENKQKIISRNNEPIFTSSFESVEDLGYGLLRISINDTFALYHKAGYQLLAPEFEAIELLGNTFIKFKKGGKWGLKTFAGRDLLKADFDDIYAEGEFVILKKYGLLAVTNNKALVEKANNAALPSDFQFEEVEQVNNHYLFAYNKNKEAVLDKNLSMIIPPDQQHITLLKNGWLIGKNQRYFLYNEDFVPYTNATIDNAASNDHWLALKRANKWTLLEQEGNLFPDFKYDSVSLLSDNIALTFLNDSTAANFSNGEKVLLAPKVKLQLLRFYTSISATTQSEYLLTTNRNGFKIVYDIQGRQIISGAYATINSAGPDLISLERYNKKGLADTTGQIVLPVKYSAIGNYREGNIALLQGRKFGLFNYSKNIIIPPEYDIMLEAYGENLFIASKRKQLGIINSNNEKLAPFKFDDITLWTDSLILARAERQWNVYNIYTQQVAYGPILDFKPIKKTREEKVMIIYTKTGYGVLNSEKGEVVPPIYNDLLNIGSEDTPVYFAEERVEAGIYNVIYFNKNGNALRKQAFEEEEYNNVYCD